MKRMVFVGLIVNSLIFCAAIFPNQSLAAPSIGGKCPKISSFSTIDKKLVVCSKKGNFLFWVVADASQKAKYQKQQTQLMISDRRKSIIKLSAIRDLYTNTATIIPLLSDSLIQSKKALIEESRAQIIDLQKQKEAAEQVKNNSQSSLVSISNSLNIAQSNVNSLQNQVNSQQSVVNFSKSNYDTSYTAYVSAKAQSDYLSYSYQNALSSNSAMMTAKVLCDFGFGSCGVYSSAQYSYNASIISQYNSANSRTAAAYAAYSSNGSQYTSNVNTLNSLKSQLTQFNTALNSLISQKNQANLNFSNSQLKISSLETQISALLAKFTTLESAEKRIAQDLQMYSEAKGLIELRSAELIVAVDAFIRIADENFTATTSVANWNSRYSNLLGLQKDIDSRVAEMKSLSSALDAYLNTL
jgi:chromosome segregation ATPase